MQVAALLAVMVTAPVVAQTEPIVATDLLRLRRVTEIDVAGDSSRAVFALRSIESEGDDDATSYVYRSHLYLLDLTDNEATPLQLTSGARRDRAAVLSPNARRIAFLRAGEEGRPGAGSSQIWLLDLSGGEARQLTERENGTGAPRWAPDGGSLLFGASEDFEELAGPPPYSQERPARDWDDHDADAEALPDGTRAEIRAWLRENAERQDPVVITRLNFQGEQSLRGPLAVRHLFLADAETGEISRLTNGFLDHEQETFTHDGRAILYVTRRRTDLHPDRVFDREVRRRSLDGTVDEAVIALEGWSVGRPRPSLDGSLIAFTARQTDDRGDRQSQLGLVTIGPQGTSEPIWMTDEQTFDTSVWRFVWMTAQAALVFTAPHEGGIPLMTISPGLLTPAPVAARRDGHRIGVETFDVGGGTIVYTQTTPRNPCVLRVRDGLGDRLVFDPNPWIADKRLSMPEEAWIDRPDGTRVQYWFMPPTFRQPGDSYPLCLEIHGGPSAMWGPGERSMWLEFQLLCAWGYGVVYSNPRGSGGYGFAHQDGNDRDWGDGPAGDVLAALDAVLALRDGPDPDRLVVTGGSYAGYLTAWIVAHDHRFKAAVAQRGVYDLSTFFGEGNAWRLVEREMGGYPWEPRFREIIRRNSPFNFVQQIRTPLLIMHASEDLRTGVSQSEMLYRALKVMEKPVEYVRYPGVGHELSRSGDPHQRLDRLNRIIEFFERHIVNEEPAPVIRDE